MNTFNRVEKTAYRVTIKNKGRDLYNQAFTNKDGNCRVATKSVKTKVWPKYSGWLGLAVKNSPRKISLLLFVYHLVLQRLSFSYLYVNFAEIPTKGICSKVQKTWVLA